MLASLIEMLGLASLIEILDSKYQRWSFVGSIVDLFHFDGQIRIKDIDVITSDHGVVIGLDNCLRNKIEVFRWSGKNVEVFKGTPSESMFESPETRVEKLKELAIIYPYRADKCQQLIERYSRLGNPEFGDGGTALQITGRPPADELTMAKRKMSKEEIAQIKECAFRSPKEVKTIRCKSGCCDSAKTRASHCAKHGTDRLVTLALCDEHPEVVAACIHCTMAKMAHELTPEDLAEIQAAFPT